MRVFNAKPYKCNKRMFTILIKKYSCIDDDLLQTRSVKSCHPERSEGSDISGSEILRCAQDDMPACFRTTYRTWLLKLIIGCEHDKSAPTRVSCTFRRGGHCSSRLYGI